MHNKHRSLPIKKIILWGIIPIILLLIWLLFTLFYLNNKSGFTVLSHNHASSNILRDGNEELLEGEKIIGEFTANDNYLRLIAIRFNTYSRINGDTVRFTIKEKGKSSWYFENTYTVDQFQPNQLFTFGIPPIPDSRGKTYTFEIESLNGKPRDAVALSTNEPVLVSQYQYPKQAILSGPIFLEFILKKTINSFQDVEFIIASISYLIPFLLYLSWLLFFKKYFRDKYYISLFPVLLIIFVNFFISNTNELMVISLILLFVTTVLAYKFTSRVTFMFALIFLLLSFSTYYAGSEKLSENFSVWLYLLLWIGALQMVWEVVRGEKQLIDFDEYLKKTFPFIGKKLKR